MNLRARAVHGVKWTAASNISVTILKFLKFAILAHLLDPNDFGLMGMLLVVIGLGSAFSDMGISNAIVWKQDASNEQLSSLYWLNIIAGVAVFGIVIAATPLIVRFYKEPRLQELVIWASLAFLIAPIGQQFQMILQRDLMFDRLAKIEVLAALIGTVVAVSTAFMGAGVYALIWGQLTETGMRALLLAFIGWRDWRPRFHFNLKELKGFIRFGVFQMGERLLNFYYTNVDYLIIGRFLGSELLGIYTIAYQIVIEPFSRINPILTRVAFPIFSRRQSDDDALGRGYCELSKMVAFLTFPILALMATTAPLFVPLILGAKWNAAITIIQILIILGAIRSLINPLGSILYAKGRTDFAFLWNLIAATLNTLVFWYVVRFGLKAVAWSENILTFFYFLIALWFIHKVIGLRYRQYFSAIRSPLAANIAMGGVLYVLYLLLRNVIGSKLMFFVVMIILGLLFYAIFISIFERSLFKEYWALLLMRKAEAE